MNESSKPVTKYVVLKITYNSYINEPPETWDWNILIDAKEDENIEVLSTSDVPIVSKNLF